MSYREFQEQVKRNEAAKKAAEEAKEKAKAQLVSGFAGYGSSSSDEETADNKEENQEAAEMEEAQAPARIPTEAEENPPAESDSDEEPPASLPAGFFAKPEVPQPKDEDTNEKKEPESKKRKAEFGSNDFWTKMIKKKS